MPRVARDDNRRRAQQRHDKLLAGFARILPSPRGGLPPDLPRTCSHSRLCLVLLMSVSMLANIRGFFIFSRNSFEKGLYLGKDEEHLSADTGIEKEFLIRRRRKAPTTRSCSSIPRPGATSCFPASPWLRLSSRNPRRFRARNLPATSCGLCAFRPRGGDRKASESVPHRQQWASST